LLAQDNTLKEVSTKLELAKSELQKLSTVEPVQEIHTLCKQPNSEGQTVLGSVLEEKDELLAAKTAEITQLQEQLVNLKFSHITASQATKTSPQGKSPVPDVSVPEDEPLLLILIMEMTHKSD